MIDFTNCEIDKTAKYEGSDQKRGIIYNNKHYMLKMADRIETGNQNELNSSYSNSVYSEHICCTIIKNMGLDVQNTLLGTLSMISREGEKREVPVVACENFLKENEELIEFKKIQNALQSVKPSKIPKIEEIYGILSSDNPYFSKEFGKIGLERYWDTFIIDAFLGNFDRHGNNWGYIINTNSNTIKLAPIYDCGSCLYPQISDEAIPKILNSEEEIIKRIETFPTAALEVNGEKVNYKKYINSLINKDCNEALKRIYPKINMKNIEDVIDDVGEISLVRKSFYKIMLQKRYELILTPAMEKIAQKEKQLLSLDEIIKNKTISDEDHENYTQLNFPQMDEVSI